MEIIQALCKNTLLCIGYLKNTCTCICPFQFRFAKVQIPFAPDKNDDDVDQNDNGFYNVVLWFPL